MKSKFIATLALVVFSLGNVFSQDQPTVTNSNPIPTVIFNGIEEGVSNISISQLNNITELKIVNHEKEISLSEAHITIMRSNGEATNFVIKNTNLGGEILEAIRSLSVGDQIIIQHIQCKHNEMEGELLLPMTLFFITE